MLNVKTICLAAALCFLVAPISIAQETDANNGSDAPYVQVYPPYMKSSYSKQDFAVQCIVAYEKVLKSGAKGEFSSEFKADIEQRIVMWEDALTALVDSKKRRKKLIKNEHKSYKSEDILSVIEKTKKQLQCDFPGEDLRGIG